MNRVAIIPALGGSKRIPCKNGKDFCGKPMIAWSIEAAKASGCFDQIIVSTDDNYIATIASEWGASVPFMRPAELSDDFTGTLPVIRLQLDKINQTHRQVFEALSEQGIGVNLHYIPVHTQPYYQATGFSDQDFPGAMAYYGEAISLPMFQGLTDVQQGELVRVLESVLK